VASFLQTLLTGTFRVHLSHAFSILCSPYRLDFVIRIIIVKKYKLQSFPLLYVTSTYIQIFSSETLPFLETPRPCISRTVIVSRS
jgi:hypothetical protein